jgi:phosphoribosylglycinamide formyltransferase-1
LPAYGGKGMYGNAVHTAVIAAKEKESGITIHFVDEKYDHGKTIFQAKCVLKENENSASLAAKIHQLEHEYFAKTIDNLLTDKS